MDDDAVSAYKREMSYPRLTENEEQSLVLRLNTDPKESERVRRRPVEGHLMTVVRIAEEYPGWKTHVLDRIIAGNEALLQVVQTYSPTSEESFFDCVVRSVRSAMESLPIKPDPYSQVKPHGKMVQ